MRRQCLQGGLYRSSTGDVNLDLGNLLRQLREVVFFFFQAEDGIRDVAVTGVQTCALPIFRLTSWPRGMPDRLPVRASTCRSYRFLSARMAASGKTIRGSSKGCASSPSVDRKSVV